MESQEALETTMAFHGTDGVDDLNVCTLCGGKGFESRQVGIGVKHSDSLNVDFLEDLDTMMEDIDNRLRVARMVSDSVIKGMVSAVEQEADEKLKAKELELAGLKRSLQFLHVNGDQNEPWSSQGGCGPKTVEFKGYTSVQDACVQHDKMTDSLLVLGKSATDQFKRLRKQIEGMRGCKIKRNGSCYEMVGLGGILKEKEYEKSVGLEKTIDNLEMIMNNISRLVDTVLIFSKGSLCEWQQECELKGELEDMVMQSSIRCIREEFQEELWDRKASCCGSQNGVLAEKFSNISDLRNELEALTRLLPSGDSGYLVSHGSLDTDNTQGKSLSQLSSRWKENGKSDESRLDVPDTFDAAQLSHLTKEDLVKFFNNMISKIKREHESKVQQMTEDYISLKGKYLSERQSLFLPTKDFEILRRKIPEVVSKLDDVLSESEKFTGRGDTVGSLDVLNNSHNTLLRENCQLRDTLAGKKNEVKYLSSQLSVASEKMSQHALSAANLQKLVKNHKSFVEDTCIEASIVEDVYKCVIRELSGQIQCMKEESELEIIAMQDIYGVLLGVASVGSKNTSVHAIKDTCMESVFMQELLETIFKETLTDVEQKFENLYKEYVTANGNLVSLEKQAIEREVELISEAEERERLRREVHSLRNLVEEKERLAGELTKAREQFELALDERNNLRKQASWQETLISKTKKELDEMSDKLLKAQGKIELDRMEINFLNQKLELAMEEIKTADDYKNVVLALSQEKQSLMSLIEAKEKEHRKQMEVVVVLVDELSTKVVDFECRVTRDIFNNTTRLENSTSQLRSLVMAANVLKRTGLLYKQKFERKCSDLQLAENEVDLLGDEVDTLLSLLEKIYIALDHYSPVLQHYSGVTEILKLVKRELSGESLKAH